MDGNQTWNLSVSWYGKAMYQISKEYLKARRIKRGKT
jgi:phosphate-selective porin